MLMQRIIEENNEEGPSDLDLYCYCGLDQEKG